MSGFSSKTVLAIFMEYLDIPIVYGKIVIL